MKQARKGTEREGMDVIIAPLPEVLKQRVHWAASAVYDYCPTPLPVHLAECDVHCSLLIRPYRHLGFFCHYIL